MIRIPLKLNIKELFAGIKIVMALIKKNKNNLGISSFNQVICDPVRALYY